MSHDTDLPKFLLKLESLAEECGLVLTEKPEVFIVGAELVEHITKRVPKLQTRTPIRITLNGNVAATIYA